MSAIEKPLRKKAGLLRSTTIHPLGRVLEEVKYRGPEGRIVTCWRCVFGKRGVRWVVTIHAAVEGEPAFIHSFTPLQMEHYNRAIGAITGKAVPYLIKDYVWEQEQVAARDPNQSCGLCKGSGKSFHGEECYVCEGKGWGFRRTRV